ncbi:nuclease-related domain-containing protein [Streptomyces hygroscopicus]|uniref:nuclease-related domain-containing protein n=1 Tax=Streptomyces hygroscopicus TaxID=1912 RepID=UPI0037903ABC
MTAESSAGARAAALRAQAVPRGLKRRFLAAVGMDREGARLIAEAGRWGAGEEGERRTAALLAPLGAEGWHGLYDRRIPGLDRANADHVLISPGARVLLVDSKMWQRRARVRVVRGRLMHGDIDKDRQVDGVLAEARLVGQALGTAVTPIIAVHNAPVDGGGFVLRNVPVIPADRLVELLRRNAGRADPAAARAVALRANAALPRYVEGGGKPPR